MYLPVKYVQPGLGDFQRFDAALQESEFYPPPYDTDSPFGMGDFTDTLQADSVIGGIPNWMLGLGAVGLLFFFGARSGKGDAVRAARQRYASELSRIDKEYSVGGRARKIARRIPRVKVTRA